LPVRRQKGKTMSTQAPARAAFAALLKQQESDIRGLEALRNEVPEAEELMRAARQHRNDVAAEHGRACTRAKATGEEAPPCAALDEAAALHSKRSAAFSSASGRLKALQVTVASHEAARRAAAQSVRAEELADAEEAWQAAVATVRDGAADLAAARWLAGPGGPTDGRSTAGVRRIEIVVDEAALEKALADVEPLPTP
jgi:hypothetical protein